MTTSKKPQPAAKKVDKKTKPSTAKAETKPSKAQKHIGKAEAHLDELKAPPVKAVEAMVAAAEKGDKAALRKAAEGFVEAVADDPEKAELAGEKIASTPAPKRAPVRRTKLQPPVLKGVDESKIKPVSAKPVTPPKARAVQRVESLLDKALGGQDATPVTEAPPRPTYEPPVQQALPPAWEAEQASTVMPRAESTAPKPKKTRAAPEGKLSFDEMMEARRVATTPAAQTGGVDFTQYFKR